ncbi:hypothetical protein [Enterococcus sp. DIV0098]|uniref:hypothetical protein n=1 Tax=Enterococcus sp. DIV0098 TaxID=2774843 RepID=UPI003F2104D3
MPRRYGNLRNSIEELESAVGMNDPKEIILIIEDPSEEDGTRCLIDGIEADPASAARRFNPKDVRADIDVVVAEWEGD